MRVGVVAKHDLTAASDTLADLEVWLRERRVEADRTVPGVRAARAKEPLCR